MHGLPRTLLLIAFSALPVTAGAQPLRVAAASDLQTVLPEIAERFQKESGHQVTLSFGSSGNFSTQIQNGAPFDVFFSADVDYPKRLEAAGLVAPGSLYEYAVGKIVVWARRDAGFDAARGLLSLTDARIRRIAIANPAHAPYGRAAVAALEHEQLYARVKAKLVLGENISQAAQFVQSGNAEAGLIALSLALAPALRDGVRYDIPTDWYPPIRQAAVVLGRSQQKAVASEFLAFITRADIVRLLQDFGFTPPAATR